MSESSPVPTAAIAESSLEWMPKSVWGPIKWKELHTRALAPLPLDQEEAWFAHYLEGLPCPKCREHFQQFMAWRPPPLDSRAAFFAWTVQAHNYVNRATGKPEFTVAEARRLHAWPDAAAIPENGNDQ
jgi:hypothetical protein